ncbi:MAG TPA: GIY-YIG nuclease family protein [Candidatus Paceibacterota bacterium]|nr:GIY-YIG nuclease family protein [Candidatus Paceibacterota bacterium]
MTLEKFRKINFPESPGVYFFKKGKTILYIGKATSLQDRIRSYFSDDLIKARGPRIVDMITQSDSVKFKKTDSVLEALILESSLIKKFQPKYNTKEKDDKSYNYVLITDEKYPRLLTIRMREIQNGNINFKIKKQFGPFPNGTQLRIALRLIQRIFPFFDNSKPIEKLNDFEKKKVLLNIQIGIYPDVFSLENSVAQQKKYNRTIKNIELFFDGKKKKIVEILKKEMLSYSKKRKYEEANQIKRTIFSLQHINDIALLKQEENFFDSDKKNILPRIESYDVAHTSGFETVGAMVVFENMSFKKTDYRKFIIKKASKNDDYGALSEILERRFSHSEWPKPKIIIVDGGNGQLNVAKKIIKKNGFDNTISIISVVKDDNHNAKNLLGDKKVISKYKNRIIKINEETHRFAISFHRKRRDILK